MGGCSFFIYERETAVELTTYQNNEKNKGKKYIYKRERSLRVDSPFKTQIGKKKITLLSTYQNNISG